MDDQQSLAPQGQAYDANGNLTPTIVSGGGNAGMFNPALGPYAGAISGGKGEPPPVNQAPKPVGMLDSGSAITQVNQDKSYLDTVAPATPAGPTSGQLKFDEATGRYVSIPGTPGVPMPDEKAPIGGSSDNASAPTGKAYFTNEAGQNAEYTQDQLNNPTTAQFLKDNGYVLTKSDGVTVNPDLTISTKVAAANKAENDVADLTHKFLSYNVDNDPAFQTQVMNIKNSFAQLMATVQKTNAERAAAFSTLGARGGTTQYANLTEMGISGDELKQADARIANVTNKMNDTIAAARTAYQTHEFSEFNAKVSALRDLRTQQQTELKNYNKAIVDANGKLQTSLDKSRAATTVENLGKSGATLTDAQLATYDKSLGGTGMAKAIYDGARQKAQNADDLKFAQSLGKLPPGATVTRDGNTYTSTAIGKLTRVTEKAKDGSFTTVFYNADGTVHSTSTGVAGSGVGGGTGSGAHTKLFDLKNANTEMENAIGAQLKQNNNSQYLAKEDWNTFLSQWEKAGGSRKSFVTQFSKYANPAAGYNYTGIKPVANKTGKMTP